VRERESRRRVGRPRREGYRERSCRIGRLRKASGPSSDRRFRMGCGGLRSGRRESAGEARRWRGAFARESWYPEKGPAGAQADQTAGPGIQRDAATVGARDRACAGAAVTGRDGEQRLMADAMDRGGGRSRFVAGVPSGD
jgi:hypothetical protein